MQTVSPMSSLREEQRVITALIAVLKQEQQFLLAADIDGLTALTPQKSTLVNDMAVLASQRHSALGAAGFKAEEAGMEAWLAASGDPDALAFWQQVLTQTHEAKELNRLNGMLINKHLSHTQGALQALRPQVQSNVYGPSGQTTSTTLRRGFVAG
ncbi:flagella synthesis protein FlgN [Pseudoduganella namucuonensis]|uniref:Flagella synthesis protein FlgN n=1 Tax=Pseudoduganella namucuonensis TaxID=1035707 RepID=A0A1I7L067_9BURK|nr:flagellar protein FlgN [Pseudoduganella namucuonensis]SFV03079.1 flagella synthesis protein FlgN [Pseudoduganella namucuonensis]